MSKPVRILNAVQGGSEYTSPNRGRRFVKKGLAVWVTPGLVIRFLSATEIQESSPRKLACRIRISAEMSLTARMTGERYDKIAATGIINQRQAHHIPLAGNCGRMGLPA